MKEEKQDRKKRCLSFQDMERNFTLKYSILYSFNYSYFELVEKRIEKYNK